MADTHSSYDDHTPLAVPGVAEVREYQAFGVLHDQQIGQASDIVSVTFGGIVIDNLKWRGELYIYENDLDFDHHSRSGVWC